MKSWDLNLLKQYQLPLNCRTDKKTTVWRDIAVRLRASGRPVLVAVNKCDSPQLKDDAAEFSVLGFPHVHPICCKHRGGINALLEEALKLLPKGLETPPAAAVSLAVFLVQDARTGKGGEQE